MRPRTKLDGCDLPTPTGARARVKNQTVVLSFMKNQVLENGRVMSHANMYNSEKELCNGTLIELEKLNDVAGIGRKARVKQKAKLPTQVESVLAFQDGVLARVERPSALARTRRDHFEPAVAEGSELLQGLSQAERAALLLPDGEDSVPGKGVTAPVQLMCQCSDTVQPEARSSNRAPPPSWVRRKGGGTAAQQRHHHHHHHHRQQQQQRQQWRLALTAEASTDDEGDAAHSGPMSSASKKRKTNPDFRKEINSSTERRRAH